MTQEQFDAMIVANSNLIDCVFNLISLNRDLFQMLSVAVGMRDGLKIPDEPAEMLKVDMTGKPISVG